VLAVRNVTQAGSGEHSLEADQLFSSNETELFSKVVFMAEKAGKHVDLMVVQRACTLPRAEQPPY